MKDVQKIKYILNNNISIFYGLIIVVSILLFGKVIDFAYFNAWDDNLHIADNYWITSRSLNESLAYFWTHIHKGLYMPLTYSVWKMIWAAIEPFRNSEKAMVYHFLCLIFHTINACLVFKILINLNFTRISSFFGALIFLVHPVQVESFAWISEFKGLFAFFWCALSTICFFYWKENTNKVCYYLFSVLFFVFALLSKPSATTLPFAFAALMVLGGIDIKDLIKNRRKQIILIGIFFFIAFVSAIITRFSQPSSIGYYDKLPIYSRIIIPLHVLGFYLSQLIIPAPIVSVYPEQLPADVISKLFSQFYWLWGILAIILPIRYKNFRWLWLFALLLIPNSGIMPFDYQRFSVVADRYQYIVMPIAVFGFLNIFGNLNVVKSIVIIVTIITFAVLASNRCYDWRNSGTLHYSALKYNAKSPSLYTNLSEFLINTRQFESVEVLYAFADSNAIKYDLLEINRAAFLSITGRKDSAKIIYQKVISSFLDSAGNLDTKKSRHDLIVSTMNYGDLMLSSNNYNEAILSYNVAKQFSRSDIYDQINSLNSLSRAYIARSITDTLKQDDDLDSAMTFSSQILAIDKNHNVANHNIGEVFFLRGDTDSSLVYFEKYLKKAKGKDWEKTAKFVEKYVKTGKSVSDMGIRHELIDIKNEQSIISAE